jgi:hypothetical protein
MAKNPSAKIKISDASATRYTTDVDKQEITILAAHCIGFYKN